MCGTGYLRGQEGGIDLVLPDFGCEAQDRIRRLLSDGPSHCTLTMGRDSKGGQNEQQLERFCWHKRIDEERRKGDQNWSQLWQ